MSAPSGPEASARPKRRQAQTWKLKSARDSKRPRRSEDENGRGQESPRDDGIEAFAEPPPVEASKSGGPCSQPLSRHGSQESQRSVEEGDALELKVQFVTTENTTRASRDQDRKPSKSSRAGKGAGEGRSRKKKASRKKSTRAELEELDTRANALQLLKMMSMPVRPVTEERQEATFAEEKARPTFEDINGDSSVMAASALSSMKPGAAEIEEVDRFTEPGTLCHNLLAPSAQQNGGETPINLKTAVREEAVLDVVLLCLGLERKKRKRSWAAFQDFFDDAMTKEYQEKMSSRGYCVASLRTPRRVLDPTMDLEYQKEHSVSFETRLIFLGLINECAGTCPSLMIPSRLAQLEQICIKGDPPCLEPGGHLDVLSAVLNKRVWLIKEADPVSELPSHHLIKPITAWTPSVSVCCADEGQDGQKVHDYFATYMDGKSSKKDRRALVLRVPKGDVVFVMSSTNKIDLSKSGDDSKAHQTMLDYCFRRIPADYVLGRAGKNLLNLGGTKLHARWRIKRNLKATGKSLRVAAFNGWTRAASFFIFNLLQRRRSFGKHGKADGVSELLHGFGIPDGSNQHGRDFLLHAFFLHHCNEFENLMTNFSIGYHGRQLRECVNDVLELAGAPSPRAVLDKYYLQEERRGLAEGDEAAATEALPLQERLMLLEVYADLMREIVLNLGFSIGDGSFRRVYESATRTLSAIESTYRTRVGVRGSGKFIQTITAAILAQEAQSPRGSLLRF